MGVTIESKNLSADMGYGGFGRFRSKVASLSNQEFGKHYSALDKALFSLDEEERDSFFKEYNAKTCFHECLLD